MRILITGGAGFIGTNISLEAKKRKHNVIVLDSLIRKGSENNIPVLNRHGVDVVRGDVRCAEDLERVGWVDAIIHLAANPGIPWSIKWPLYDFNINTVGTLNVLELARKNTLPVIFASTNKVYSDLVNKLTIYEKKKKYVWKGKNKKGISEIFPVDGQSEYSHSPYGVSKLSSDLYCQEYFHAFGFPTVINRMSCIYGLYQNGVEDQGWIDFFVRQSFKKEPQLNIFGDGKQVRDMLWGGDLARLYMDELENIDKVKGQVFNVGGGVENTLSLIEAIEDIEKKQGVKFHLNHHEWRHADQKVYISDITKVKSMLGWSPTISPTKGISLMISAYKNLWKK